jgi:exosortase E/protease (VPEID-CTERM system)
MIASEARFSAPLASSFLSLGLAQRIALFALLFSAEWIPLSDRVHHGRGLGSLFQLAAVSGAFFLGLLHVRFKGSCQRVSQELQGAPIGWGFLASHFGIFLGAVYLAFLPLGTTLSGAWRYVIAAWCCMSAVAAIGLAFCAFVPPRVAWPLIRRTRYAWAYASVTGLIVWRLVRSFSVGSGLVWNPHINLSWKPATDLTFGAVNALLHLLLPQVVANRATMTIGSPSFNVTIFPPCAGLEGTALMLVFSVAWLWFFRRDFRFPAAFVLIPVAMVVMWITNAIRITALILIGVAGSPDIAVGGFHSQAGWIAFNGVAFGFAILSLRIPWFIKAAPERVESEDGPNATVAYLMPVCAILAAAMISQAVSGDFEWLYPLRFVAAAVVLWMFRRQYAQLDWRVGWFSVAAGGAVFAMWLGLDRLTGAHSGNELASGLARWPESVRIGWLAVRTTAAVVTVPIAEELAFRCFLIRRLMSRDFQFLGAREYSVAAVLVSSLAFGALHGDRWLAGFIAGLVYAFSFLRRGSTGDAVVAHATTNALLAVWVLTGSRWFLW